MVVGTGVEVGMYKVISLFIKMGPDVLPYIRRLCLACILSFCF